MGPKPHIFIRLKIRLCFSIYPRRPDFENSWGDSDTDVEEEPVSYIILPEKLEP